MAKVKKKKTGRKTKLTQEWLDIAEEVLHEDINAIILTDNELREEINDRISRGLSDKEAKKKTITDRTFESWKAGDLKDPIGNAFLRLYKKALRTQKQNLFAKLQNEDNPTWQRYAWIIERKFDNWNLRNKNELTGKDGGPVQTHELNQHEKERLRTLITGTVGSKGTA